MATRVDQSPLWFWLTSTLISFMCFILALLIFLRERRKRNRDDLLISFKYLSIFSHLCIALGPVVTLLYCGAYIPGICVVSNFLMSPAGFLLLATMEYYQLSRLYYCFSRNQVHSDSGYPDWVFAVLFTVSTIWLLTVIAISYTWFPTECIIEPNGMVMIKGIYAPPHRKWISWINLMYGVVELITLFLYWYKVRSLRTYENQQDGSVHDRIQSVLHRVLILTFFYLFIGALLTTLKFVGRVASVEGIIKERPFGNWVFSVMHLSISYSMFLMQDHNTSEYVAFLRFVRRYKCIWCFCCFGYMVNEQYRILVDNVDERTFEKKKSIQTANTRNISADVVYRINATGIEFSNKDSD